MRHNLFLTKKHLTMKRHLVSLLLALLLLFGAYTATSQTHDIVKPPEDADNWEIPAKAEKDQQVNIKYIGNKYVREVTLKPAYLPLPGVFSVSDSKKVRFSKGNLQYQPSSNTWRFAANQFDLLANNSTSYTSTSTDWIDLFGWGTWTVNGADPWETSTSYSDYKAGISRSGEFKNDCKESIGSDWKTLSQTEWSYLLFTRTPDMGILYSKAKVHGVNGLVLLPDEWNYIYNFANSNTVDAEFAEISNADWATLESKGAVFLPAAGYRRGVLGGRDGSFGYYWSSTASSVSGAYDMRFGFSFVSTDIYHTRDYRRSVRLVCNLKE